MRMCVIEEALSLHALFLVRSPALLDDGAELLELALRAKERPQLQNDGFDEQIAEPQETSSALTRFFVSLRAFLS